MATVPIGTTLTNTGWYTNLPNAGKYLIYYNVRTLIAGQGPINSCVYCISQLFDSTSNVVVPYSLLLANYLTIQVANTEVVFQNTVCSVPIAYTVTKPSIINLQLVAGVSAGVQFDGAWMISDGAGGTYISTVEA